MACDVAKQPIAFVSYTLASNYESWSISLNKSLARRYLHTHRSLSLFIYIYMYIIFWIAKLGFDTMWIYVKHADWSIYARKTNCSLFNTSNLPKTSRDIYAEYHCLISEFYVNPHYTIHLLEKTIIHDINDHLEVHLIRTPYHIFS